MAALKLDKNPTLKQAGPKKAVAQSYTHSSGGWDASGRINRKPKTPEMLEF